LHLFFLYNFFTILLTIYGNVVEDEELPKHTIKRISSLFFMLTPTLTETQTLTDVLFKNSIYPFVTEALNLLKYLINRFEIEGYECFPIIQ